MTNKKLLEKLKEDMEMRGFSHYTKDSYYRKAKEITEYAWKKNEIRRNRRDNRINKRENK